MFKTIRYTYHLTKAEKLIKKGISIDDERIEHHKRKIRKILYKKEG